MEPAVTLPIEITILGWSTLLVLFQVGLQGMLATRELGGQYNASPRDEGLKPKGLHAGRAERALRNLLETYPIFVALALALTITGQAGGLGAAGSIIWIVARIAYVPLYVLGIPYVRSLAWVGSVAGLLMMLIELLA
ncbi:membrane protein [Agaricicola taiwanensis]|uniref:Membrane protein n=1 Tax=Agaricicola taiwanensis TaxID=591372 RepID=A0A8J2VD78_9RHOB|nr:MAPEG family protein [Agaricicola taiwanensis]GGE27101.1 membrane protein [Agaricicola taiwanensis]